MDRAESRLHRRSPASTDLQEQGLQVLARIIAKMHLKKIVPKANVCPAKEEQAIGAPSGSIFSQPEDVEDADENG